MPYMMGGFPDQETSLAVADRLRRSGADLIELGVPFSDPLADGPTIHAAATAALAAGATLETALEICAAVADRIPVVLMVYSNMVLATAAPRSSPGRAAAAGAAGAIVPDLPLGEAGHDHARPLGERGLALVPLVAPTTPPERRAEICASAQGFVYVVSTVGRHRRARGAAARARRAGRGGEGRGRASRSRSDSGSALPSRPRRSARSPTA